MNNNIRVKQIIRELKKQSKKSDNSATKAAYRFLSKQMLNNTQKYNNKNKAKGNAKKGKNKTKKFNKK